MLLHPRWAMSFLRGPMTRVELQRGVAGWGRLSASGWVFDTQDWTAAASPGTTDDIPALVLALANGIYEPSASLLEYACMQGDGLYPIALPVVRSLVDALSRCPPDARFGIIAMVSFLASRAGDQAGAEGTVAACRRETIYAFTTYVHLLETAGSDGERHICVDMLDLCADAEPALRARVVALLEHVAGERAAHPEAAKVCAVIANTLHGMRGRG